MSLSPSSGDSQRIGIPGDERSTARRQTEHDEASRRYSTIVPRGAIKEEGQLLQKASGRPWSGWVVLALWLVVGVPGLALIVVSLISARGTIAERILGGIWMCFLGGLPLLSLLPITRNWLQRRNARRRAARRE
jgi:hypothetical protein